MAYTKKPSPIQGLVMVFGEAVGFLQSYIGVDTGGKFIWTAQSTSNVSGGMLTTESLSVVAVPSGTASGATITITNSQITNTSVIFLTPAKGDPGKRISFRNVVPAGGTATFTVDVADTATGASSTTTAATDVWYLIIN